MNQSNKSSSQLPLEDPKLYTEINLKHTVEKITLKKGTNTLNRMYLHYAILVF